MGRGSWATVEAEDPTPGPAELAELAEAAELAALGRAVRQPWRPTVILTGHGPLRPALEAGEPCPVCEGRPIGESHYCAQCDRLGPRNKKTAAKAGLAARMAAECLDQAERDRIEAARGRAEALRICRGRLPERVRRRLAIGCRALADGPTDPLGRLKNDPRKGSHNLSRAGLEWLASIEQLPRRGGELARPA